VAGKRSKVQPLAKPQRLVLPATATIRNAEAIHAQLADCLGRAGNIEPGNIEIDCTGVTDADLSLVQLLLAVRKSARRDGRTVVLSAPAAGVLREVLAQGGFLPSVAGNAGDDDSFWLDGTAAQ
jgi:anti-anti-sigma regulatory factor